MKKLLTVMIVLILTAVAAAGAFAGEAEETSGGMPGLIIVSNGVSSNTTADKNEQTEEIRKQKALLMPLTVVTLDRGGNALLISTDDYVKNDWETHTFPYYPPAEDIARQIDTLLGHKSGAKNASGPARLILLNVNSAMAAVRETMQPEQAAEIWILDSNPEAVANSASYDSESKQLSSAGKNDNAAQIIVSLSEKMITFLREYPQVRCHFCFSRMSAGEKKISFSGILTDMASADRAVSDRILFETLDPETIAQKVLDETGVMFTYREVLPVQTEDGITLTYETVADASQLICLAGDGFAAGGRADVEMRSERTGVIPCERISTDGCLWILPERPGDGGRVTVTVKDVTTENIAVAVGVFCDTDREITFGEIPEDWTRGLHEITFETDVKELPQDQLVPEVHVFWPGGEEISQAEMTLDEINPGNNGNYRWKLKVPFDLVAGDALPYRLKISIGGLTAEKAIRILDQPPKALAGDQVSLYVLKGDDAIRLNMEAMFNGTEMSADGTRTYLDQLTYSYAFSGNIEAVRPDDHGAWLTIDPSRLEDGQTLTIMATDEQHGSSAMTTVEIVLFDPEEVLRGLRYEIREQPEKYVLESDENQVVCALTEESKSGYELIRKIVPDDMDGQTDWYQGVVSFGGRVYVPALQELSFERIPAVPSEEETEIPQAGYEVNEEGLLTVTLPRETDGQQAAYRTRTSVDGLILDTETSSVVPVITAEYDNQPPKALVAGQEITAVINDLPFIGKPLTLEELTGVSLRKEDLFTDDHTGLADLKIDRWYRNVEYDEDEENYSCRFTKRGKYVLTLQAEDRGGQKSPSIIWTIHLISLTQILCAGVGLILLITLLILIIRHKRRPTFRRTAVSLNQGDECQGEWKVPEECADGFTLDLPFIVTGMIPGEKLSVAALNGIRVEPVRNGYRLLIPAPANGAAAPDLKDLSNDRLITEPQKTDLKWDAYYSIICGSKETLEIAITKPGSGSRNDQAAGGTEW